MKTSAGKDALEHLDNRELMGLISLIDQAADRQVGATPTLYHPKTGRCSALPLLKRLVTAAASRGLIDVSSAHDHIRNM
jgi:hypothetical protein